MYMSRTILSRWDIDDLGDTGYRVIIEEAAPDNAEVAKFIADELALYEYKDIEIRLEW